MPQTSNPHGSGTFVTTQFSRFFASRSRLLVLSCFGRMVVTGTLPGACYAQGVTAYLYARGIRIFDYPQFAAPLRDTIRERAHQELARSAGIVIEHIAKVHIRKEDEVAKLIEGAAIMRG